MPQPELPEPAHPEVDSMLSRKFGKEVANYFSGRYSVPVQMNTEANLSRVSTESSFLLTDRPFFPLGSP